jgi:D-beta-D-heptose 7-phosphate kinase/D-beta-D-heptose 1-phosphate adenosyltransferase
LSKIISLSEFTDHILPRSGDATIVYTNGCFDLLHRGHLQLLKYAKAQGDILVVGLNSDKSVANLKGPTRPIKDQVTRAKVMEAFQVVDWVIVFDDLDPLEHITEIIPDVLVKGSDYRDKEVVGSKLVAEFGGWVEYAPFVEGHSTTKLLEKEGEKTWTVQGQARV